MPAKKVTSTPWIRQNWKSCFRKNLHNCWGWVTSPFSSSKLYSTEFCTGKKVCAAWQHVCKHFSYRKQLTRKPWTNSSRSWTVTRTAVWTSKSLGVSFSPWPRFAMNTFVTSRDPSATLGPTLRATLHWSEAPMTAADMMTVSTVPYITVKPRAVYCTDAAM